MGLAPFTLMEPYPVDSSAPLAVNESFYRCVCRRKCLDSAFCHRKWFPERGTFPSDLYVGIHLG